MPSQQVVAPPARAGMFLTITVDEGSREQVLALLADVPALTRSVGFRVPDAGLVCVVGIGAHLWDRLFDFARPKHLHPFEQIAGSVHTAVSTPGDLLVHLRSDRMDTCFELAHQFGKRLTGWGQIIDEVHGFKFFDERDLLGFVDGTENPEGDDAVAATRIGDDDPAYAGGSYVIVQKYLHDLDAWQRLSIEEQQRVIGRSKLDDIEMPDDVKPTNSHVALNTIEEPDGTQRKIVRDNMPFGSIAAGEFGTYFIGYAADPGITEQMLRNMFIGKPPGNTDRILEFSTAVTGALFFIPTAAFLEDPQGPSDVGSSESSSSTSARGDRPAPADGSLAIGSLRRHHTVDTSAQPDPNDHQGSTP